MSESENEDDGEQELLPSTKKARMSKAPVLERVWKQEDIEFSPIPDYSHPNCWMIQLVRLFTLTITLPVSA